MGNRQNHNLGRFESVDQQVRCTEHRNLAGVTPFSFGPCLGKPLDELNSMLDRAHEAGERLLATWELEGHRKDFLGLRLHPPLPSQSAWTHCSRRLFAH